MTNKPRFSPGPWSPPHLSEDSTTCNCVSICDGRYAGCIASVHVHNGIDSISHGGNDAPPLEEAKANGYLIAAAPEIYDALREFQAAHLAWINSCSANDGDGDDAAMYRLVDANNKASAVLAKAEGRS